MIRAPGLPSRWRGTSFSANDPRRGTRLRATKRETIRLNTMVSTISRNICPARPGTKRMGTNTARVVSVEAVMAMPTSSDPLKEAEHGLSPKVLCL